MRRKVWIAVYLTFCALILSGFSLQAQSSDPETWPIVYQDSFEDAESGWPTGETEYAKRSYVSGKYQIKVKDDRQIAWSLIPGNRSFLDFTVEIDAHAIKGRGEFGIIFRYQDPDNFYLFTLSTGGGYRLLKKEEGSWQTLISPTPCGQLQPDNENHLKIVAQKNTFSFFLNYQLLTEFTDETITVGVIGITPFHGEGERADGTFRAGKIGLCAGTFEKPKLTVSFENFLIREDLHAKVRWQAKKAFNKGKKRYDSQDFDAAIVNFEEALSFFKELKGIKGQADTLWWLGRCHFEMDTYSDAIEWFKEAFALYKKLRNFQRMVDTLNKMGSSYCKVAKYKLSIDYYTRVLDLSQEIKAEKVKQKAKATALKGLGDCYLSQKTYSKAIKHYIHALSIYRELENPEGEASTLNILGDVYRKLNDYRQAINYYKRAVTSYQAIGSLSSANKIALISTKLGNCFYTLSENYKAIEFFSQALAIYQDRGDKVHKAMVLNHFALCYRALQDYKRAIEYHAQSLAIIRLPKASEVPGLIKLFGTALIHRPVEYPAASPSQVVKASREIEVDALLGIGVCYRKLGNFETAFPRLKQALAIAKKAGYKEGKASILVNLGLSYYSLGDYKEAIDHLKQALSTLEQLGYQRGKAAALGNLGLCYQMLGDSSTAISYHEKALEVAESTGYQQAKVAALINLGSCYWHSTDQGRALNSFREALFIAKKIRYLEGEAGSLSSLGWYYYSLDEVDRAINYFKESLIIDRIAGDNLGQASDLINLGTCYIAIGSYRKAMDEFSMASSALQTVISTQPLPPEPAEMLWHLSDGIATAQKNLGNEIAAVNQWRKAIELVERMRRKLRRAGIKSSFMKNKFSVYSHLVLTLLDTEKPEEAIFYTERAKARTLVDMIETAMGQRGEVLPAKLQTASQKAGVLSGLHQAAKLPAFSGAGPAGERSGLSQAAQRRQKEYEAILAQLEGQYPELGDTLSVNPTKLKKYFQFVQGKLGEGTVALEYYITKQETLLWPITKDGVQTASEIKVSRSELYKIVDKFRQKIQSPPSPGQEMVAYQETMETAKELYELLISPVEEQIKDAKHLVIIPSDVLFYLPFGALYRCPGCEGQDLLGGKFLIEDYSISYAPSVASLYWPFQNGGSGKYGSLFAIGNPTGDLKHAREEVEAIATLFGEKKLLLDDEGAEKALKDILTTKTYDVIHLSTHGLFDQKMPLLSHLLFKKGEGEDGSLYAGEILGFDLSSELIVLSACQTALPPELTEEAAGLVIGDELQGLSQSLFVAGTPSAVLTLWNVDDRSTRFLMEKMYQALKKGSSKGEALREAKRYLLDDPVYRHPYYWAPFVLYGVWR